MSKGSDLESITNLKQLWLATEKITKKNFPKTKLKPIVGGGKLLKPKFMLVFINPTYRNISSAESWKGARRPWTGTKYIWKIFSQAGLFDKKLFEEIHRKSFWDESFADEVYAEIKRRSLYLTNIVKWTGENADLPDNKKIALYKPILEKEIEIVDPKYIVTLGLIPFKALTGKTIKLGDYYSESVESGICAPFEVQTNRSLRKIFPCYFPVGRGNPKRATELLCLLGSML